jgi:hypothetical protein
MSLQSMAQNLLPNPGLETNSGCPSSVAQMYLATGWNNVSGHSGSADYLHTCGGAGTVGVPSNYFGSQTAHTGNAYMGFALYYQSTPSFREYLVCSLSTAGLTPGNTYTVTWWISCADNSSRATDDLQYYFSASPPTWGGNWNPMTTLTPQAAIPSGTYISNKTAWVQFSASFTASGGERYMTMGNFLSDAATSTIANGAGAYTTGYIYIDDGVLQASVVLSADIQELSASEVPNAVRVEWQTLSEAGNARFEVERSAADYNHFEKVGSLEGAGDSQELHAYQFEDKGYVPGVINYYRLKVIDQNGEATYSNAVGVETTPRGEHLLNFYPNPAPVGTAVQFTYSLDKVQSIHAVMMDVQGRKVRTQQYDGKVGANQLSFETQNLPAGEYLLQIHSGIEQEVRRITLLTP